MNPLQPMFTVFKKMFEFIINHTEIAMNQIFKLMIHIDNFINHMFSFMFKQLKYFCFLFLIVLTLVFLFSKEKYSHMLLSIYVFIYLLLGFAIILLVWAIVALGKKLKTFWDLLVKITKMKDFDGWLLFEFILAFIFSFFAIIVLIITIVVIALGSDWIQKVGNYLFNRMQEVN